MFAAGALGEVRGCEVAPVDEANATREPIEDVVREEAGLATADRQLLPWVRHPADDLGDPRHSPVEEDRVAQVGCIPALIPRDGSRDVDRRSMRWDPQGKRISYR